MKKIHWFALAGSILLLILALILFAFVKREEILQRVISKTILSQREKNHLVIRIGSSHFTGLSSVEINAVSVIPENRAPLMFIRSARVQVSLWPLFTGKVKLADFSMNDGWVHLLKNKGLSNYDFLFKKKDSASTEKKAGMAEIADRLLESSFSKVPEQMEIHNFLLLSKSDSHSFSLLTRSARIQNHYLDALFRWGESDTDWHLTGTINPGVQKLNLKFFALNKAITIPYLQTRFKLGMAVDTIYTSMNGLTYTDGQLTLNGSVGVSNLVVNQAKIASEDILFPKASLDAKLIIGPDYITLDSSSTIHLRKLNAHPYLKYRLAPVKTYAFMFKTENTEAQKFFDSFPSGIFTTLAGIKVTGALSYRLDFALNEQHPDDLVFQAGFQKKGFRVLHEGAENLTKINTTFIYTPYELGKPMRSRIIGPANPEYTPSEHISPYLRAAAVASEDPNFYTHHGIDEYAFKKVIAIDYKAKSFKRGASTITMQLVKNVFLSREKTISRKAEEMLIAWLLENAGLSSKQRMLEVYLNLIEWAPDVYGVGEAAHFYFGKSPASLSLGESIFLTSIIPKPKAYQTSFNADGSLKNSIKRYYRFISSSLLARGKILPEDTSAMFFISLKGPAARYVIRTPVTPADSGAAADSSKGNFFDRLINVFKAKEEPSATRARVLASEPGHTDSARAERLKRREERRKKNKGKFLGIF